MVIGGAMAIAIASIFSLTGTSLRLAHDRSDRQAAFYHAENALQWAAQLVVDNNNVMGSSNYYSTAKGTLGLAYMVGVTPPPGFVGAWVSVVPNGSGPQSVYTVTAEAQFRAKVSKVQAVVTYHPASPVFDYEYFLNNWGWWWGSGIIGNGGQRSNWNFDFQWDPVLNGVVMASGQITSFGSQIDLDLGNAQPDVR